MLIGRMVYQVEQPESEPLGLDLWKQALSLQSCSGLGIGRRVQVAGIEDLFVVVNVAIKLLWKIWLFGPTLAKVVG